MIQYHYIYIFAICQQKEELNLREYENLRKTSHGRLKTRAYYIPYATLDQALSGDRTKSPYFKLLNGEWDFKYFERDDDVPSKPGEIENWDKISVPSCWQFRGYGQIYYTNTAYTFPVDVPYVPDENPCGVYRTSFETDELWAKRDTNIVFEGVSSCLYLYINGQYVGFTQGSHLQAEFDISKFVKPGKNVLEAKVLTYCAGSYLECQDQFRLSGIFRDVYLLSREKNCIRDVKIEADTKEIKVGAKEYEIYDGKDIADLENPILWNAEKPHLYTVVVKGETEFLPFKIGMRDVKISKQNEILINKTPVKLKGVNHHDTHPTNGFCMTDEELRADLCAMKKLNINTVRMSHYPPTPEFLNMCDEMGFYVIDETDIETHGFLRRESTPYMFDVDNGEWPCDMPEFEKEFKERMERMIERDKNHPCIIMWSTGNESGFGRNHRRMIELARSLDDTRLIHCEDLSRKTNFDQYTKTFVAEKYSDVFSAMYPSIEYCDEFCASKEIDQPLFLCEFSHAKGIAPGDVKDYVECMYRNKSFVGGCIWEWADHTLLRNNVPTYGGDYGESDFTFGDFCADGLVFHDRTFSSGSLNTKYSYQYFDAKFANGKIKITNRYDFTDLSERELEIYLNTDGEISHKTKINLSLAPHKTTEIPLPFDIPESCRFGANVVVKMYNNGFEEGMCEIPLKTKIEKLSFDSAPCVLEEDEKFIFARGENFEYKFSKLLGSFVSMKKGGKETLASPVRISAYRAPTDNECKQAWLWNSYGNVEKAENLNRTFTKVYSLTVSGNKIKVRASLAGIARTPFFKFNAVYEFFKNGEVKVSLKGNVKDTLAKFGPEEDDELFLPRLGFEFATPSSDDGFTYYGMGDGESYCDMHFHTLTGMYKSRASKEYVNYITPQEHGNHYGCKYLKMDSGLEFFADSAFEINVSQYTAAALDNAKHTDELSKSGVTNVRVDYKVSGIGSAGCGPALDKKYRLDEKEINFSFIMK